MNAEEDSDNKSEPEAPDEATELRKKKKRSHSSENGAPKRKKQKTEKHKKKKRESSSESVSSDTDSSVSTKSSSSSKEKRKKRKKKKHRKEKKKKVKREKGKKKKKKKRKKKQLKDEEIIGPVLPEASVGNTSPVDMTPQTTGKSMAPMTKEEWEKKQSVVRRVFDEETGRHRLIKGDGEVLEEIVSKERHREINRQATVGDGTFFQTKLATLQPK